MTEDINVSGPCKKYWATVFEMLKAAGDYSSAVKLYANLIDADTAWKAQSVLDEGYYQGEISYLRDAITSREDQFFAKVNKLNILCKQHNIMVITKPEKLLELLLDPSRRRSYREKAKRRLKKGEICPIQSFEKKK